MCTSCGCGDLPNDHGDSRNITLLILRCAAEAADVTLQQAAANIGAAAASLTPQPEPEPEDIVIKSLVAGAPKRFVLGVAYPASQIIDGRVDRTDGHREFMTADEVEAAAWDYARNHRRIGFYHVDGTEGHADLVESYIYRGPDWVTTDIDGKEQVIKAGDWVMGAILDEPAFDLVVKRKADGWSVDGVARRRRKPVPIQTK